MMSCGGKISSLSDEDISAIKQLNKSYIQVGLSSDCVSDILDLYEEDAVVLEPMQPPVRGKSVILARNEEYSNLYFKERNFTIEEIDGSNDLSFIGGILTQTYVIGENQGENSVKMLHILRKQPDGTWLISVTIYHYNLYE